MVKKPKLTGANLVPIGFGSQNSTRKSIFDRIVFPGVSIFDRMGARRLICVITLLSVHPWFMSLELIRLLQ